MAPTSRCQEHGLAYDPEVASGCVLCRQSLRAQPVDELRSRLAVWLVALLLVAAAAGAYAFGVTSRGTTARKGASDLAPSHNAPAPVEAASEAATVDRAFPERGGTLTTKNSSGRSGAYFIAGHDAGDRLPVLVAIHGTGGTGRQMVATFKADAARRRLVIVAPDSRRSPQGQWTWQVGDKPGEVTPDLTHTLACLSEVQRLVPGRADYTKVLLAGHSGGASSAPYIATNREPFSAFAVLHGGVFPGGLGNRRIRGWFSTGKSDGVRTPAMVRQAAEQTRAEGFTEVTYREFPGGHGISDAERTALLDWWLGV